MLSPIADAIGDTMIFLCDVCSQHGLKLDEVADDPGHPSMRVLQEEQIAWRAHNFPDAEPWMPVIGVGEEIGELADLSVAADWHFAWRGLRKLNHGCLKLSQGIRGDRSTHLDEIENGVWHLMLFLEEVAATHGLELWPTVFATWEIVRQRDWQASKETGN